MKYFLIAFVAVAVLANAQANRQDMQSGGGMGETQQGPPQGMPPGMPPIQNGGFPKGMGLPHGPSQGQTQGGQTSK